MGGGGSGLRPKYPGIWINTYYNSSTTRYLHTKNIGHGHFSSKKRSAGKKRCVELLRPRGGLSSPSTLFVSILQCRSHERGYLPPKSPLSSSDGGFKNDLWQSKECGFVVPASTKSGGHDSDAPHFLRSASHDQMKKAINR